MISLGIDIQDRQLSLVALKGSAGSVQVAAHDVYPLDSKAGDRERVDAIEVRIQDFLNEKHLSPGTVFLGIPRNTVMVRYLALPAVVKENLEESLGYELEKYMPFSAEEVYFDYQVNSEEKSEGLLKLLLVAVQKEVLAPYLTLAGGMNLGISSVEISATAFCNVLFEKDQKVSGKVAGAFVYVHGDQIELGFVNNGILLYSRALPLTKESGAALVSACEKMRQDMQTGDESPGTVFCAPDENMPLLRYLENTASLGDLSHWDPSRFQIPAAELVGAYGLALRGIQKVPMQLNLLPSNLRKKPSKSKYYILFALAFMILASALAWIGGIFLRHQWTLDGLDSEISKLRSEAGKMDRVRSERAELVNRVEFLNAIRRGGPPVLDVLGELSDRIPDEAWISRFDFSKKGIQIQGVGDSTSELIPLLEDSPMFAGVAFLSAITKDRRSGKERFRIGLSIK